MFITIPDDLPILSSATMGGPDLYEGDLTLHCSECNTAPWVGCAENEYQLERERDAILEKVKAIVVQCHCDTLTLQTEPSKIEEAVAAANTFADLCKLVKNAHVYLSFFGAKYVTIENCEGTLDIDTIAKRAIDLIDANPDFSLEERAHGMRVACSISKLYRDSDVLVGDSCCLTKLIVMICDLFKLMFSSDDVYNVEWHWEKCSWLYSDRNPCGFGHNLEEHDGYHSTFGFFTAQQLVNDLGISPDHTSVEPRHGPHNRCYGVKNFYWHN